MASHRRIYHFLYELMLWLAVAGAGFFGIYYFDELKGVVRQGVAVISDRAESLQNQVATRQRAYQKGPQETSGFDRLVYLKAARNGHFYARAHINGKEVEVLVDTGATSVLLTYDHARRIGIDPSDRDYTHSSRTANGTTRVAPVMLDHIRIGDIMVRNVRAFVAEPSKSFASLLGMTFLGKLKRVDIRGSELVLVQ